MFFAYKNGIAATASEVQIKAGSLIYTGRVVGHQAKSQDEMQAVADALSLLANIVMA